MSKNTIKSEECNGWSNWETWAVSVVISNDEGLNNEAEKLAQRDFKSAERLEDFLRDLWPSKFPVSDCESISYRDVNFKEIINSYLED